MADTTSQAEIELARTERAHAPEVEALRRALATASHERDDYLGQLMQLRGAHEQLLAHKVSCMHTRLHKVGCNWGDEDSLERIAALGVRLVRGWWQLIVWSHPACVSDWHTDCD